MQDMNTLRGMGLLTQDMVDGMQDAIDEADPGNELQFAQERIDLLQQLSGGSTRLSSDKIKHTPKHKKDPLPKNRVKRRRKVAS